MLDQLPIIEQEKDDIKFTEQYVKATELFIRSLENSQLGRIKKFRAIYQMTRHQQEIVGKLGKAQLGDTRDLEGVLDKLRDNFQSIMDEFFKLNPSLIEKTNKEIKRRTDLLPEHGQDKAIRAEHYFRMMKDERNPDKKPEPKDKVQLVQVVNKTSIPVKLVGSSASAMTDLGEERTVRKKFLSFLNFNERGRSSRSLFSGGGSSRGTTLVAGILTGQGLVNLPRIISSLLVSTFGKIITKTFSIAMAGIGLLGRTVMGRLITVGVSFLTGIVETGITNLVGWLFGEDSGITKAVKDLFQSGYWSSAMGGGAIGAGLGSLFGPAGMFWGFIIGSVSGLVKAWIDDDGPKKLAAAAKEFWESVNKGIDDLYGSITNSIIGFFGGIKDYFRKIFKPNEAEQIDSLNKEIAETKQQIELNKRRLEDPNAEVWRKNIAKSELDRNTNKLQKLEDQKLNVKPDSLVAREEDIENLRIMDERLKRPFRNKIAEDNYRKIRDDLANKINSSATNGLVKPFEAPVTTNLHDTMIGQKRMEFMNSIMPGIINSPSNIMTSTNISNRTTNSLMMQLSPLSRDNRIE